MTLIDRKLIIVGAGGHGRETAMACQDSRNVPEILGFLDDSGRDATPEGWPIIGTLEAAEKYKNERFVVAINDPRVRRSIVEKLTVIGVRHWQTILHKSVQLHESIKLGDGVIILNDVVLTCSITIGNHCILNRATQISHDCVIKDFCSLNPSAVLSGNVHVGNGCEIGSSSVIKQGIVVGEGAVIGLGAAVVKNVMADEIVVGVPAKTLKHKECWTR